MEKNESISHEDEEYVPQDLCPLDQDQCLIDMLFYSVLPWFSLSSSGYSGILNTRDSLKNEFGQITRIHRTMSTAKG
jgi:hypothetical protein